MRREATLVVVHSMKGESGTTGKEVIRYRHALDTLKSRLSEVGIEYDIHEYVLGHAPAEDLLHAVEEFNADLLVIGYRRRTAVGKTLLGSHAQEVLMGAKCPVLAIVAPEQ